MSEPTDTQLALRGGPKVFPEGPPVWPPRMKGVEVAIATAMRTGTWGQYHGPARKELEQKLAAMAGVEHAWTCCSGTFAVELALRGLGVGEGDEVILAAYDFAGNFRAVEAIGAKPVLVDIDPRTWSLDAELLPQAMSPQVKAILVSHLHGGTADMAKIMAFAEGHSLGVVEDACQVPGARIAGKPAGSWGDVGVFSFGGSKLITAGRGGAIVSRRADVLQRAKVYCERGNDAYPLSELQASVILPQLEVLGMKHEERARAVAQVRADLTAEGSLQMVQGARVDDSPAYYKIAWKLNSNGGNISREDFISAAQAEGLAIDSGFRGMALRPTSRCRKIGELESARQAAEQTLLLHHPILTAGGAAIQRIAIAIRKVIVGLTNP